MYVPLTLRSPLAKMMLCYLSIQDMPQGLCMVSEALVGLGTYDFTREELLSDSRHDVSNAILV
jgi:hypothetical protein